MRKKLFFLLSLTINISYVFAQITLSADPTFGNNGFVYQNISSPLLSSYYLSNDKKLISSFEEAITTQSGSYLRPNMTRVDENGIVTTEYIGPSGTNLDLPFITNYNGNQYQVIENQYSELRRYNYNHILDATFGSNGSIPNIIIGYFPDNSILASNSPGNFIKYSSSGQIDNSFGNNGVVINNTGLVPQYGLLKDNHYYYSSNIQSMTVNGLKKINYNTGNLDTSYGNNGTGIISNTPVYLEKIHLLPNGEVINVYRANNTSTQYYVSKTLVNGQLDTLFGNGTGYIILPQILNGKTLSYSPNYNDSTHYISSKNNTFFICVPHLIPNTIMGEAFVLSYSISNGEKIFINNSDNYLATGLSLGNYAEIYPHIEVRDSSLYIIYNDQLMRYNIGNSTLSLSEVDTSDNKIYVNNPVDSKLNTQTKIDILKVDIYNQIGSLVLTDSYKSSIDISHLITGVYNVKFILKNGKTITKTIIKK